MVILPKICAQLRPLLGFRWEIASTSKLEAPHSIVVQGIGRCRHKQVSARQKKHVPRQYQYFQKMSFTVLRNRMKWSKLQQDGRRPESLPSGQAVNSQKRVESGGLSPTAPAFHLAEHRVKSQKLMVLLT